MRSTLSLGKIKYVEVVSNEEKAEKTSRWCISSVIHYLHAFYDNALMKRLQSLQFAVLSALQYPICENSYTERRKLLSENGNVTYLTGNKKLSYNFHPFGVNYLENGYF